MRSHTLAALSACLLLACCLSVVAQSGRRQPPPVPSAPVPTPTPEPTPVKLAPPAEVRVLVTNNSSASMNLSMIDSRIVADTLLQRLHASKSLKVETADRMSRDAARKRAKAEENRFVIWIELQTNGMSTDTMGGRQPYPEDLHIQYIIYQPGTGATKANGNVYLRTVRTLPGGRGTLPDCYPNRYYGLDVALMVGAIETADRIFSELSVPSPPLCP
ncbi:MAG: hypothetical protein ACJ74W_02225 [Pyrinomonadaceae bacterium]